MHRHQKFIVLFFFILLLVGGGIILLHLKPSAQISQSGTISARSEEYLQKKSREDATQWKYTNLTIGPKRINEEVSAGSCFSFVIVYSIVDVKENKDEDCMVEASTNNPKTRIIAYQKPTEASSIDSVEGISFRRTEKDTYRETVKNIGGRNWYIFTTKNPPFEYNAFYLSDHSYEVFNVLSYGADDLQPQLLKMLESIQ